MTTPPNNPPSHTNSSGSSVLPISPQEIISAKRNTIPDEVIEVFNQLIATHWNGKKSTFKQKEAETLICEMLGCEPAFLYSKHYLDIEEIYEQQGWSVQFDQPTYNESYDASFTFRAPPQGI